MSIASFTPMRKWITIWTQIMQYRIAIWIDCAYVIMYMELNLDFII